MTRSVKFPCKYDYVPDDFISISGDGTEPEFAYSIHDDGSKVLEKLPTRKNLFADIQCYKDSGNIELLLARSGGDLSQLQNRQGFYADVSDMPDNLLDFMNSQNKANSLWLDTPVVIKEAFDNDFNKFFASMSDSDVFYSKIENAIRDSERIKYGGKYYSIDEFSNMFGLVDDNKEVVSNE